MPDFSAAVRINLPAPRGPLTLQDRVLSVRYRYGRAAASNRLTVGSCDISALNESADPWYDDDGAGGRVSAAELIGQTVDVLVNEGADQAVAFAGWIDRVAGAPHRTGPAVRIGCVDAWGRHARRPVALTAVPAEKTGARMARLLGAAVIADTGQIECASAAAVAGDAGALAEQVAETEGGDLAAVHTARHPLRRLVFYERGRTPARNLDLAEDGRAGSARLTRPVVVGHSTREMVSKVEFTDAAGALHTAAAADSAVERTLRRTLLSGADATQAQADWWAQVYAVPRRDLAGLALAPTFEPDGLAIIDATTGDWALVRYESADGADTSAVAAIDYVEGAISPIPDSDLVDVEITLRLKSAHYARWWLLGTAQQSALGRTTRLGPHPTADPAPPDRRTPGGRHEWTTGELVTDARFGAHLTAQTVPSDPAGQHPDGRPGQLRWADALYVFTGAAWVKIGEA